MNQLQIKSIAERLIAAYDNLQLLEPITASHPEFSVSDAYAVLDEINRRREASGWKRIGRKIGFTNRTIWPRYGVDRPNWAPMYSHTVHRASNGHAKIPLGRFVQPRIEPEIVFGLRSSVPVNEGAREALGAVEWMAAGFEIVQCHFPNWKFGIADCTASFGLHACLVVGPEVPLDDPARDRLATLLPSFETTLERNSEVVARGRGSNVLDSPALALQYVAQIIASQPQSPPLEAGESITTGTLTDAHPIVPGECWRSDYGKLGVPGLELQLK
jgi:2-oxo-3-hexenedioate decarboxylase